MFFKDKKNVINKNILELLNEYDVLIKDQNKYIDLLPQKIVLATKISSSKSATEISAKTSNEIEGISEQSAKNSLELKNARMLIQNYNEVLTYIKEYTNEIRLTEKEILSWHNQLFRNTTQYVSVGGKFKTLNNKVINEKNEIIFEGAEPWETPIMIEQLCSWFYEEKEMPDILKVIIFILDFLTIHPFNDGNGRISRLITNYLLLKIGLNCFREISFEEMILETNQEYLFSLNSCNRDWRNNNSTYEPFIEYMLTLINKGLLEYKNKFSFINLLFSNKINKRQMILIIMNHLIDNKIEIKRSNIMKFVNEFGIDVKEETAKNVLEELKKQNFIILEGSGKSSIYKIKKWDFDYLLNLFSNKKSVM